MAQPTPLQIAKDLIDCLEKHGQGDYIGESISQLEHSLQAAHQAKQAGQYSPPPIANP
jgi:predicted HD phosphohydrolase